MMNGRETSRSFVRLTEALIMLACCATHFTFEAKAAPVISATEVAQYLSQFGYLPPVNPKSEAIISEKILSEAISDFQSFVGINVTGNIDAETTRMMNSPRCGVKDKVGSDGSGRSRRYAAFGPKWQRKNLSYKISKYPKRLDRATADKEIARALAVWSEYTDLTFTPKSGKVDIEIGFVVGYHGDGNPFDGPGSLGRANVLAHAYSPGPGIGGDAHFDDTEKWTVNSYHGVNLFQVAAHEIGHSLGLDHSRIYSALMAPMYRNYEPNFQLHRDDITGIQALYGRKTRNGDKPTGRNPEICDDPQIDTIFDSAGGHTYVFKGKHYWMLKTGGIVDGYPKLIAEGWEGLPSNIDAAFTYNGRTYFFKGSEYWTYIGSHMEGRSPRKIGRDFPGIPDNVGAATVWDRDGLIYFFKESKFWKLDPSEKTLTKRVNSKPISSWPGLPEDIDAVHSHGGHTHFFKGGVYYRFDDRRFSLDPHSPYKTGLSWFGCYSKADRDVPRFDFSWYDFFSRLF